MVTLEKGPGKKDRLHLIWFLENDLLIKFSQF